MNIENISSLTEVVKKMGFGTDVVSELLQNVCLHPQSFNIRQSVFKESDTLNCTLYFESNKGDYSCLYYDAALLKEIVFPDKVFNGININALNSNMAAIDWKAFGMRSDAEPVILEDMSTWKMQATVEKIVTDLARIYEVEEAKLLGDALKLKYWYPLQMPIFPIDNLSAAKAKFEIGQRFYIFNGQGISVDEAWRFLNNKWMERMMRESNKQTLQGTDRIVSKEGASSKKSGTKKVRVSGK